MEPARASLGRRLLRWLPLPAAAAGVLAGGIVWVRIWFDVVGCPDDMSEGRSAAPGSPYAAFVCADDGSSFTWLWIAVAVVAAVLAVLAVLRDRRPLVWSLALLVGPAVLLAGLQLAIPKDCATGRTETGDCSRDREQF